MGMTLRVSPRAWLGAVLLATGCQALEDLPDRLFDQRTQRERYEAALASAGLSSTALAADWLAAADRALREAPRIAASHAEEGYLAPSEPVALAFRIQARRGQRIHFELALPGDSVSQVFLDAWQVEGDTAVEYRHVESADSGKRALEFEPRRDGEYVLRIQPELLRGGRFRVTVRLAPTLAFPVSGRRENDVGSRFGVERDGGARSHHGIDIFAPRGTPVIASRAGVVRRVEVTNRGGKVVWLTDDDGNRLYYAHLDSQRVRGGDRVELGDTLGTVGNTGNAITTPPHLHFGIYRRGEGPVDPWWFVHSPGVETPRLVADTSRFGKWVRTALETSPLLSRADARADSTAILPRHTTARVVAAVGGWYRVRLPDGTTGYLAIRATEPAESAVRMAELAGSTPLLALPGSGSRDEFILTSDGTSGTLDVLGRFGGFLMVRTANGQAGWIEGS